MNVGVFALAAVFLCSANACELFSQTLPQSSPDPMAVGKQALAQERWGDAQAFFESYLKQNSGSAEAQYDLAFAYFGEKQYAKAEGEFQGLITVNPNMWSAHTSLAEVFAAEGRWPDFDKERALVRGARDRGEPGTNKNATDVIDVLFAGDERYIVRESYGLTGRFHSRYTFSHFGKDGKLDFWIACESDDIDQTFFAQKHPKEAAAGQRSFSLDSYTQHFNAEGQLAGQTHGTIKFYPDGEPTYETVRADVMSVLNHKSGAMSTTTTPVQPQSKP